MCEHGRQVKELFSKIKLLQLYGANPNSFTVDPNIAITFVPVAVAVCIKPESLQTTTLHNFISATVCKRSSSFARLIEPGIALFISSQISLSILPPNKTIV